MNYKRRDLGRKLQAARQAKGLTLRAAAEALGIGAPYLSRIESGINALGKHAGPVAQLYGLDREELEALAAEKLPRFGTYLRAKYDLSPAAIAELEDHFTAVKGGRP